MFQFYENIAFVCLFVFVYFVILNSSKWAGLNQIFFYKTLCLFVICYIYLFGDTLH